MTEKIASRRRFLAATGATLVAPYVRAQSKKAAKVSVGRQPWAAGNSPVTQYMIANKTFERFAAEAGYDLTVDYRDYPSALPMVEAFVSGNLDFGMWGNTPIVRLIGNRPPSISGRMSSTMARRERASAFVCSGGACSALGVGA